MDGCKNSSDHLKYNGGNFEDRLLENHVCSRIRMEYLDQNQLCKQERTTVPNSKPKPPGQQFLHLSTPEFNHDKEVI